MFTGTRLRLQDKLQQISIPTLILVGADDPLIPAHFSRLMHQTIQASRLVIVENAAHCLPIEKPDRVNSEICKFLQELNF
jgi:pimeloyl-ACP methyl ester carboxylesterase